MSDGYRDEHLRRHKIAHENGESCSICGQLPDGSYPWSKKNDSQKIKDINRRLSKLEKIIYGKSKSPYDAGVKR